MQPAFGQPGGQLRVPVHRIAEAFYLRGGDGDERGVAAQRLVQAHPVQLVPQRARAHRSRQIGPAVHAGGEALDVVQHHPVRHAETADGHAHAGAQQVPGQATARVHPPLGSARGDDALQRGAGDEGHLHRAPAVPRRAEPVALPGPLGRRDQGELQRRGVHVAAGRRAGRVQGGRCLVQRHHRHRELVDPVRTGQRGHVRVRKARVQPGGQAGRVGQRQELGQHGAGVPVDVPVAAFAVAPAGAPRDAGDDHGRAAARPGRRWPGRRRSVAGRPARARGLAGRTSARRRAARRPAARPRTAPAGSGRPPTRRRGTGGFRSPGPWCAPRPRTGTAGGTGSAGPGARA